MLFVKFIKKEPVQAPFLFAAVPNISENEKRNKVSFR